MLKKAVQQGRSKRRGDAYSVRYVELLSDARTKLADFFSILLGYSRTSPTERTSEPEEVLNRQRLCPASRSNIQSLQCLGNRMKFMPFVSQGIDERFPSMRKGCLHERAKCDFFLPAKPRTLFRAQQQHC